MMYKYWTAFESEEHCLYPKEVAQLWDIYSCSAPKQSVEYNDLLVGELLKDASALLKKDAIYYETRYGLKRVYDHETIQYASELLKERVEHEYNVLYCRVDKKRYKFVVGEKNVLPAVMQLFPEYFEDDGTFISRRNSNRITERKKELKERKKANS